MAYVHAMERQKARKKAEELVCREAGRRRAADLAAELARREQAQRRQRTESARRRVEEEVVLTKYVQSPPKDFLQFSDDVLAEFGATYKCEPTAFILTDCEGNVYADAESAEFLEQAHELADKYPVVLKVEKRQQEPPWKAWHVNGTDPDTVSLLRDGPDGSHINALVAKVQPAEFVEVLQSEFGFNIKWCRIRCEAGEGWVPSPHLEHFQLSSEQCQRCGCTCERDEDGHRVCWCDDCWTRGCYFLLDDSWEEEKKEDEDSGGEVLLQCQRCGCTCERGEDGERVCWCDACCKRGCYFLLDDATSWATLKELPTRSLRQVFPDGS